MEYETSSVVGISFNFPVISLVCGPLPSLCGGGSGKSTGASLSSVSSSVSGLQISVVRSGPRENPPAH